MAGHSKWANIKRHKAKIDAKRGKVYTKLIREITISAKIGGADANANPRLRAALEKAQEANMTKDIIERAIKRGTGGMEGENLEEVRYEGYGPGGIAVMVDCMTNNRNRTVSDVRYVFSKSGGNLGTDGSVAYLFKKQGIITFAPDTDEERLIEHVLELSVEDVITNEDNSIDIFTTPETMVDVKDTLLRLGFQPAGSEISMRALVNVSISDKEIAEKIINLIDLLEDLEDVQSVYSNADIAEKLLKEL